jgi:hypothetical protein
MTAGMVKLKKREGAIAEVPLEELSEADQEYIRSGSYGRKPRRRGTSLSVRCWTIQSDGQIEVCVVTKGVIAKAIVRQRIW